MTQAARRPGGSLPPETGVGGPGLLGIYAGTQGAGALLAAVLGVLASGVPAGQERLLLVRVSYWLSSALLLAAGVVGVSLGRRRHGALARLARWPGARAVLIGAGAGLALKLLGDVLTALLQGVTGPVAGNNPLVLYPQAFAGPLARGLLVFAVVCVAPAAEELFFRALLLGWLRRRLPRGPAVALAGALFGLAHVDPVSGAALAASLPLALPLGVLGAGLCLLYERYQTLWVPAAAHAAVNGVSMALVLWG